MPVATFSSALFVSGCIIVPTPHFNSGDARANFDKKSLPDIHPGVTTREEVLLKFGEPDAVSRDERMFAYREQKILAVCLVFAGTPTAGAIPADHYFLVQFDDTGVVQERGPGPARIIPLAPDALVETNGWTSESAGVMEPGTAITGLAIWHPNTPGHDEISLDPKNLDLGFVTLTPDEIQFRNNNELFNSEPEWTLPYHSLTNFKVVTGLLGPRVVIWTRDAHVHSFSFTYWHPNRKAKAAAKLIQSKIESNKGNPPLTGISVK
jgi:hypothetical protein